MNAERYQRYENYMLKCMGGDSAHDTGHVRRVLYAAVLMGGSTPNVNMDVLITAALLHDVGREAQFRTGENHALAGAKQVREYLLSEGEAADFAAWVADCIRTHRFRSDDPPATIEAKLLYDADKLDVSGGVGVARTLMYGGHVGHPIYSVGPDGTVLSGEEKIPSFYSEYRHKLQSISSRFLTEEGRRRAKKRSETAARFNDSLRAEVAADESGSAWRMLDKTVGDHQRRTLNLAMMLAGDSEKITRAALAEAVLAGVPELPQNAAERAVADAFQLEEVGALGAARRLMELGERRQSINLLLNAEWQTPAFYTAQARGIAAAREPAAREFIAAVRAELDECREEGESILREYLNQ